MKKILPQNKKGQIFTLLAIALIALMFLSVEVYSHFREKEVIKNRVESMDSYLQSLEKNLENQAYTAGFRIIFLALSEKSTKGQNVNDIQTFFEEAFFNGTVDKIPRDIMSGATLQNMTDAVNKRAKKINVNISMENTNITVSQDDPWRVKFTIVSDFVMRDLGNLALWEKTQNITTYIPVESFEDPLYVKMTNGLNRSINRTIYEGEYNVSGDLSNLSAHFSRGYFTNNTAAPSFLKRLEGDLTADPNGIESFVNPNILSSGGIDPSEFDPTGTKTRIDYIYFNKSLSTSGSTVVGMPSQFRIDDAHKSRYQLLT